MGKNRFIFRKTLSLLVVFMMLFATGCTSPAKTASSTPAAAPASTETTSAPAEKDAEGKIAYKHLLNLADGIGARVEGTKSPSVAAMYIKGELRNLGYKVTQQGFSAKTKRTGEDAEILCQNVIAEKKGDTDQVLVIGAHFDSVDIGDGADDNASGVGVLLELAERIKDLPTNCTIRFIAFGAEEDGLLGSTFYMSNLSEIDQKKIVHVINLDTLIAGNKMYVYGDFGDKGVLREAALKAAAEMNIPLITQQGTKEFPKGTTGPYSDHVPFAEKGIPYTYFEATDWDLGAKDGYTQVEEQYGEKGEIWHSKYDTLEYINKTFPGRTEEHLNGFVRVIMKIVPGFKP